LSVSQETINKPLLIVAGAGTGKTATLCSRVAHLILNGVSPKSILVITFTNKAANELRERLQGLLLESRGDVVSSGSLAGLPLATTFHSFCYQLMLRYFDQVGYSAPPAIITSDTEKMALLKLVVYNLKDYSLLKQCEYIIKVGQKELVTATPPDVHGRWETVRAYAKGLGYDPSKAGVSRSFNDSFKFIKRASDRESSESVQELLSEHRHLHKFLYMHYESNNQQKSIPNADGDAVPDFRQILDTIHKAKAADYTPSDYLGEFRQMYMGYERLKRQLNLIDFDDMLVLARAILKVDRVREAVTEKYKYLLIDEFQDLNKLQMDIVVQLQGQHGHITAVGDERQSIYGFRGAQSSRNFGIFFEKFIDGHGSISDLGLSGTYRSLTTNYRSSPSIVEFGNHVISASIDRGRCGEENSDQLLKRLRVDLHACGEYAPEANVPIRVWRFASELDEAKHIAREIQWLTEINQCTYSDIAILCRCLRVGAYSVSSNLQKQLLQLGIPVRVLGGRALIKAAEWQNFLALLRVIANPRDDIAMRKCLEKLVIGVGSASIAKIESISAVPGLAIPGNTRAGSMVTTAASNQVKQEELNAEDDVVPADLDVPFIEKICHAVAQKGLIPALACKNLKQFVESLADARAKLDKDVLIEDWVIETYRYFMTPQGQRTTKGGGSEDSAKDPKIEILQDFISSFLTTHIHLFAEWGIEIRTDSSPDSVNDAKPALPEGYHSQQDQNGVFADQGDRVRVPCTMRVLQAFIAHVSLVSGSTEDKGEVHTPSQSASQGSQQDHEDGSKKGTEAVTISTIHQAKGLEWPVVFVPHFNEGFLPMSPRKPNDYSTPVSDGDSNNNHNRALAAKTRNHYEEERRLAYVAVTRSRQVLYVSSVKHFRATPILTWVLERVCLDHSIEEGRDEVPFSRYLPKQATKSGSLGKNGHCMVEFTDWNAYGSACKEP
ncbi:hypothetical protein EV182_001369, partial [Spiromyces aspiralis]